MKTFTFNTTNELKSATASRMGTNPDFKFSKLDIKSINGKEVGFLEITNKHITSEVVGGRGTTRFQAPFNVELK